MMMNLRYIALLTGIILFSTTVTGCFQSDYTKLVKSELEKGVRNDSLLFGIHFGDSRQDFYGKCFDLNKKHLVTQGPGNTSVQYLFTDSLLHDNPTAMRLLFFPAYDDRDIIAEMDMEFSYPGWAPWNKAMQSEALKEKTRELLMTWYKGNDFVVADVNNTPMLVKLDGNRRVLLYEKDAQSVSVKVQDILHPRFKHSIN